MKKILTLLSVFILLFTTTFVVQAQEYQPLAIRKHNEGVMYYNKGQYENAIDCFTEAIAEDPNFIDSYYNLGVLYEYLGENDQALVAYKKLLDLDNYNPEAAYKIAYLYSRQKNYGVALNYLKLVPEDSPRYQSAMELKKNIAKIRAGYVK